MKKLFIIVATAMQFIVGAMENGQGDESYGAKSSRSSGRSSAKMVKLVLKQGLGPIIIPEFIKFENNQFIVKKVDDELFQSINLRNAEKVYIPSHVEVIGEDCFALYIYLAEVLFGKNSLLKTIARGAFEGAELKSILIPLTVEIIGQNCFAGCRRLVEILFAEGSRLKRIEKHAFSRSGLKSIHIPANVEVIGKCCFFWCQNLGEATFEAGSQLKTIESSTFYETGLKSMRIPANVEVIGKNCFNSCESLYETIFEPGSKLKRIEKKAFNETNLISISIPSGVEFIGRLCFGKCRNLRAVHFESPQQPPQIGHGAFFGCLNLESTNILNNLDISKACSYLQLIDKTQVVRNHDVMYRCFSDGSARAACFYRNYGGRTMPVISSFIELDGKRLAVTELGDELFQLDNTQMIVIPPSVEIINDNCFYKCSWLKEVVFEMKSNLKRIENWAFFESSLRSIRIPESTEVISSYCFSSCQDLGEVIFEGNSNLKRIQSMAFLMTDLKSIIIPAKVELIGEDCFYNCRGLREVIFEENSKLRKIGRDPFANCHQWLKAFVPSSMDETAQNALKCSYKKRVITKS